MFYYFYVKNCLEAKLHRQEGIETIEWIALAAVILVFLFAMLGLMTNFGRGVANAIYGQIMKWIGRW